MAKMTRWAAVLLAVAATPLLLAQSGYDLTVPSQSAGVVAGTWTQSTADDFAPGSFLQVDVIPLGDGALTLSPASGWGSYTSTVGLAEFPFNALGACWRAQIMPGAVLTVSVRTSAPDRSWSPWYPVGEVDEAPGGRICAADPLPAYGGLAMQYRLSFEASGYVVPAVLEQMELTYIDSTAGPTVAEARLTARPLDAAVALGFPQPGVIPRAGWGADESLRFDDGAEIWPPEYRPTEKIIIHHTVTQNDSQDPAVWVRAIYYYHAATRGWGDIGYNYLVDRNGNLYEGRYGGLNVVGGHARPYNYGTVGIGSIGTYGSASGSIWPPSALLNSLAAHVAWECARSLVHPQGHSYFVETDLPNIAGHRECLVNGSPTTSCPGDYLFAELAGLRSSVWSRLQAGLPAYDARFFDHNTPLSMQPGQTSVVSLALQNGGTLTWSAGGTTPVHAGYHWYDSQGQQVIQPPEDDHRTSLPADVPFAGRTTVSSALVTAPNIPGQYRLEWDMVREGVTWFSWQGSTPLAVTVTVVGDPTATSTPTRTPTATPTSTRTPTATSTRTRTPTATNTSVSPSVTVGPSPTRYPNEVYLPLSLLEYNANPVTPTATLTPTATATSTPTATSSPCAEGVTNGGFEYEVGWDVPASGGYPAIYTSAAFHSGQRSMRLGITDPADQIGSWSSARQLVTIPSGATSVTLRFWLYALSGEPPLSSADVALAPLREGDISSTGDLQLVRLLNPDDSLVASLVRQRTNDPQWRSYQYDLTAYAGQTLKLYFAVYNDGVGGITSMYLDDVSLQICSGAMAATNDRFGLCFVSAADNLASEARYEGALATGTQWDRWPLYWHWVDEGGYVGSHSGGTHDYDALVSQEVAHGIVPIAILLGTADRRATAGTLDVPPPLVQDKILPLPGQAPFKQEVNSTASSPPEGLFEPIFSDGTDIVGPGKVVNQANTWADFVHNSVERYRPGGILATQRGWAASVGVRHWEIWNEPDLNQFWTGSVAEYYRLLEVGYKTIKATDPQATVLSGGLAFFEKPNWLGDLLALTGGDPKKAYFDVLSYHYYWAIYVGENWMSQSRALLDAHGLPHVPIWITESGVPVWDDFPATLYGVPPDSPWRGTMEEQAAYVVQNTALAFYRGIGRVYHFMIHDDCGNALCDAFGLRHNFTPHVCNPAQGNPRPAYAAYQLAIGQFRGLTPLWRQRDGDQDQLAFYRPDDSSRVVVLWAADGHAATATVQPTGESAELHWVEPAASPGGTTGIARSVTIAPTGGVYTLILPAATNRNSGVPGDPTYYIGGRPYILVERDTDPPVAGVEPLSPTTGEAIVVRWKGDDLGSGVASYDVWVSEGDAPLRPWITATGATSATYTGLAGHTYSFAVRARDRAGNQQPVPSRPQATTSVQVSPAADRPAGSSTGNGLAWSWLPTSRANLRPLGYHLPTRPMAQVSQAAVLDVPLGANIGL